MNHMKLDKLQIKAIFVVVLLAALVGCSTGKSAHDPTPWYSGLDENKRTIMLAGLLPDWDLKDMVERSDAIALGVIDAKIDIRTEPGGINNPPTYHYEFTNFKLTVEEAFYPKSLPDTLAVLAETGVRPASDDIQVAGFEGTPSYLVGEHVLLFMESLADDQEFGDGASRPVPDGYTVSDYYLAVHGGNLGKIERGDDGKWEDSRTGETFTTDKLKSTIEEVKGPDSK